MAILTIINQPGPLPIKSSFDAVGDEPMYLEVNGSVWSRNPNTMIGIAIELDGESIGNAQIFSNEAASHRTVVPAYINIQLGPGKHLLTLLPLNSATISDSNDLYTAVIHY